MIGIYSITNKVNGKKYIGQSKELHRRWIVHKWKLKANRHHAKMLQNSWNKYGEENFEFSIIQVCNVDKLDELEIYWIKAFNTTNNKCGYNTATGGHNVIPQNKVHRECKWTDETVMEIIEMLKSGVNSNQISQQLDIPYTTIRKIKSGETWVHLTGGPIVPKQKSPHRATDQQKEKIVKLLNEGYMMTEICEMLNVSYGSVRRIKDKLK